MNFELKTNWVCNQRSSCHSNSIPFQIEKKIWRKLRKGFHKLPTKETVNQLFLFPEGKSERVCVNLRLFFPSLSEHLKSQCRNEMWLITFIASIIYEQWEISATTLHIYCIHTIAPHRSNRFFFSSFEFSFIIIMACRPKLKCHCCCWQSWRLYVT